MTPEIQTSPEADSVTYVIALNRLPQLRENIRALNKRAEKYGLAAPFTLTRGRRGQEFLENRSEGFAALIETVEVTVTGKAFSLGNYRVKAALDHASNSFSTFGGFEIPGRYLTACATCDHCQAKRQRSQTFLLADANGDIKQVGSTCVEDFTGTSAAHAFGATSIYDEFAAMQKEFEPERDVHVRMEACKPMAPYLAIVARRIRQEGWVSSTTASSNREMGRLPADPTSRAAFAELAKLVERAGPGVEVVPVVDPQDLDVAAAALLHARAAFADVPDRESVQEFDANMWSVSANDTFLDKHAGFAAFIVRKYDSEVLEPARRQAMAATSEYVGEVKKRELFTLTIDRKILIDGDYGIKTLCLMHDQAGNQLQWTATGLTELEVGKTYVVKATVKKHDEYQGVRQTQLSRAAVESELGAAAAREAATEAHEAHEADPPALDM